MFRIHQSSSSTGASPDCLMSYPRHLLGESYPSAEVQSVFSSDPADSAFIMFDPNILEQRQRLKRMVYSFYSDLWCSPMAWETEVQSQVESYQRLKKRYLIPHCLKVSIVRYVSKVKWSNPGKGVPWRSSYWKRSLWITLTYSRQLRFTLLRPFVKKTLFAIAVCLFNETTSKETRDTTK